MENLATRYAADEVPVAPPPSDRRQVAAAAASAGLYVPGVRRAAIDRRFHALMVATASVRSASAVSLKCGRTSACTAVRATVELRRAQLDEVEESAVDDRPGEVLVEDVHRVVDAGRRGGVVDAGTPDDVTCLGRMFDDGRPHGRVAWAESG